MATEFEGDFDEFPADAVWLQIKGETNRAYAAFCIYRNAGPRRSLRQACRDFYGMADLPPHARDGSDSRLRQIAHWSSQWDWVDRAQAYTTHLDQMTRIENMERTKAMLDRHAAWASVAGAKAFEKIKDLDGKKISAREATQLLEAATRIERMARGQSSDIVESIDPVVGADRTVRDLITANPAIAVAAAELSLALSGQVDKAIAAEDAAASAPILDVTGVEETDDADPGTT